MAYSASGVTLAHSRQSEHQRVLYMPIRRADLDGWHARPLGSDRLPHEFGIESTGVLQQFAQGAFHHRLTADCGAIKNAHILHVSAIIMKAAQRIIGAAKD